jgi:hypothetical protein
MAAQIRRRMADGADSDGAQGWCSNGGADPTVQISTAGRADLTAGRADPTAGGRRSGGGARRTDGAAGGGRSRGRGAQNRRRGWRRTEQGRADPTAQLTVDSVGAVQGAAAGGWGKVATTAEERRGESRDGG